MGIGKITGPQTGLVGVFTSDNLDLKNVPLQWITQVTQRTSR